MRAHCLYCSILLLMGMMLPGDTARAATGFQQTNLVSDIPGLAVTTDPALKNPWGIAFSPTSPFWVANNGTGLVTLYDGFGTKLGLVVAIPPGPTSAPTGAVFNALSGFFGDRFLFATENGTIAGWQSGTNALLRVDNSGLGAVYKGLAIANDRIYATNFGSGQVDVFDSDYAPTTLLGGFTDPNLPSGYAPFGIRAINGDIYVTYALKQTGTNDDQAGPGFGFVDKFDLDGILIGRLISGGALNSPWGLALAPAGFGDFGGDLLVGNFGDGAINAYNPTTGGFIGALRGINGNPLSIDGLWSLDFGNGGTGFAPNTLYFTAGINNEEDGLFGSISIQATPEPGTLLLAVAGAAGAVIMRKRSRQS